MPARLTIQRTSLMIYPGAQWRPNTILMQKNKISPKKPDAQTRSSNVILGIDPGLADTGYGVIQISKQKIKMLACGSIKTAPSSQLIDRLDQLHRQLGQIIKKYRPDQAAVEELFFCKNAKTALAVGQARGVCLMTLAENKLTVNEFTPLEIKQALTGYGRADKNQVGQMVKILLNLKIVPRPDDAADALATALPCLHSQKNY